MTQILQQNDMNVKLICLRTVIATIHSQEKGGMNQILLLTKLAEKTQVENKGKLIGAQQEEFSIHTYQEK